MSETCVYDIIFAGGGTTACVTAGRLAQADPSLRILIIETGPHTRNVDYHVQPARYMHNLTQGKTFSHHTGPLSQALGGRAAVVHAGRCLGGGSSVNFVMYTRASASDYDDWEKFGNPGWGSKDLIPLARKVETFQAEGVETGPDSSHGLAGPIKISRGGKDTNIGQEFLQAASKYDKGRKVTVDFNDFKTSDCDSYGPWYKYIDAKTGKRSDTAHHFIYDQGHDNLSVLVGHRVVRVIIENKRAVGVEYIADESRHSSATQVLLRAFASHLVVVSSGAFGSPAILERSGIGAPLLLSAKGIKQVVDLSGVGENYNDHNIVTAAFVADGTADSLDDIFSGQETAIKAHLTQWQKDGTGNLAHNSADAGVKMRPNTRDLKELGSGFEKRWKDFFVPAPDKPVALLIACATNLSFLPHDPCQKVFTLAYFNAYPLARGHVHIRSGTDPYAPLDFDPGYLEDYADVAVLRWCYKHARELARRMTCYRGELLPGHPAFSPDSAAAAVPHASGPVDVSAPTITYTKEDDEKIDEYTRRKVQTTWHSLGTCSMKPREAGGVVDSNLNVYGVSNLKVADMSIAPLNVCANTYNTALIIGEKAAIIIAQELGIKGVSATYELGNTATTGSTVSEAACSLRHLSRM